MDYLFKMEKEYSYLEMEKEYPYSYFNKKKSYIFLNDFKKLEKRLKLIKECRIDYNKYFIELIRNNIYENDLINFYKDYKIFIDLNYQDKELYGNTFLMVAIQKNKIKLASYLINNQKYLGQKNKYGCTALIYICKLMYNYRELSTLFELVLKREECKIYLEQTDNIGYYPIHSLITDGFQEYAIQGLEVMENIDSKDCHGRDLLYFACVWERKALVKKILEKISKFRSNKLNYFGWTVVYMFSSSIELIKTRIKDQKLYDTAFDFGIQDEILKQDEIYI